ALGTRVKVPTVEGEEDVEVKAGTQPGTEIRLRGRGVPHLRRTASRGDLHVIVDISVPMRLSKAEREALKAYADAAGEIVADGGGILDRVRDALG
ncbi:MAG: J domain-containing protein, partial [Chloroflexi bacterium]|nr:J domain-containing protein [Chloroflexota bacterium]